MDTPTKLFELVTIKAGTVMEMVEGITTLRKDGWQKLSHGAISTGTDEWVMVMYKWVSLVE